MIKIAIKRLQNMDEEMSKVSSKIREPKETEKKEQKKRKLVKNNWNWQMWDTKNESG